MVGNWSCIRVRYRVGRFGGIGAEGGDVGCGMWDVGCGMWDVGCGMWDVGVRRFDRRMRKQCVTEIEYEEAVKIHMTRKKCKSRNQTTRSRP
jgi:hypothetical protein